MNNQSEKIRLDPIRVSKRLAEIIIGECEYWCLNFSYLSGLVSEGHDALNEAFNNSFTCSIAARCNDSLNNVCCSLSIPEMKEFNCIVEMVNEKIAELIGYEPVLFIEEGPIVLAEEGKINELLQYIKAIEQSVQAEESEGNNIEHE